MTTPSTRAQEEERLRKIREEKLKRIQEQRTRQSTTRLSTTPDRPTSPGPLQTVPAPTPAVGTETPPPSKPIAPKMIIRPGIIKAPAEPGGPTIIKGPGDTKLIVSKSPISGNLTFAARGPATLTVPNVKAAPKGAPGGQDITIFAKSFFGDRNGLSFEEAGIKEGTNYTNETLATSLTGTKADRVTRFIINQMAPIQPLVIFELNPGIGTTTLSFLNTANISSVCLYEPNPQIRQMLQRNIDGYQFGDKATVATQPFQGTPVTLSGAVVYIGNMSDPVASKWLQRFAAGLEPNVALVVARLRSPAEKSNIQPREGITCRLDTEVLETGLFVCRNEKAIREMAAKMSPVVEESGEEVDLEWKEGLREFLRQPLSQFLPLERVEGYLSDEAMDIWVKTFTHLSFDPNFNYEELEKLGDKVIDLTFQVFLMKRYPDITPAGSSAYKDRYASKAFQAGLANRLGMAPWVRVRDMAVNIHVREDVLEAFIGGIFTIGGLIGQEGQGYSDALRAIEYIYGPVDFDPETMFGRGKTQIKEWFEGLHWGPAILDMTQSDYGWKANVYMTDDGLRYLQARRIQIPRLIGEAAARTEKLAAAEAYENALVNLRRYGVTRQWIYAEKEKQEFSNPVYAPYLGPARERLRKEGYETMRFVAPKTGTTQTSCLVQLIGFLPSGRKKVLESMNACDYGTGKVELLKRYVSGS